MSEEERKEKARKRAKEHYYKNKETHLKANKRWKEKNPEKVKEYEKKRYEKRKQLKQENERLQEDIGNYVNIVLHDRKEIERLKSIIKEVREYVKPVIVDGKEKELFINGNDILEILEKEN